MSYKIIIILLILSLVLSCSQDSKETIVSPEIPDISYYTISGKVIDANELHPLSNVIVVLDTLHTKTDQFGIFNFKNISSGTKHLTFRYHDYHLIDTTIIIKSDTLLTFGLSRIILVYNIEGNIRDSFNLKPVNGVSISLDSVTILSDSTGYFYFENVRQGNIKLLLKHPKYINSEIFIELKSDKYLQISFSPILLDYFPIEEGNSWKYSTSYRLHEDAGMTFVNGLIEITVLATDSGIESSAYIFLARVDYLIESKQWGSEMDSSYIQKDIEFIITQHTDGTLEISDYQSDFVIGKIASTFRCTQLKRYYPAYMGENIIKLNCGWSIYTSEVLLEEEMGIKDILFNDASMGASYPGIFRLNLIDYRVNKDTVY